ncbi:hypothetical protein CC85DRAFT_107212 [Cutaneotrichosporon oleaginosum]|uniref:Uncharacterized protein n=1 Tax=Cutaneotrichosporon oleaginosum TaxID=879819 RepID=A0A0J0XL42_9TREE|nr:uncharacterized protein CC85DRAFT_107212 [Cutaneotrichosporon oleaginosum]KLT41785.1 hypothetical protein CC85DRAFT_107212 [Cutaneotrichosporon oleaginosum]TXT12380.1 hypothetical protein COLE_02790 [Cutaneotrichosporon oleaginosum]
MIQVSVNGGKLPTQLSAEAGKSLCTALSQSNLSSAESASPADKPNSGSSLATDAKDADHAPGFHIQSTPPPTPTVWHSIEDTTDEAAVCAGKGLDATEALPRGECPPPFPGSYPGTVWPKSDRPVKPIKVGSPRPRLPHEPKLRFSTIELDAEYDNYPVLARMWLATRDAYEVSDPHDLLTWHNVAIMLDFACWALPRAWAWFTANQRAMYLAARQLAGQVLTGISDALRSWGQYALLCAIEEQRISWGLLPLVLCRFLSSIQELLAQRYTADTVELRTLIDESSRSTIFNLYLRLTVPQGNDKLLRTLLRDSEPFTAFSSISNSKTPHSTAADVLRVSCLFIGEVIESLTQLQLIIVLLFSGNATPVVASMAIVLMQYCISSSSTDTELARVERKERNKLDHRRQALFQIAGGADYRQEVNLFQIGRRLSPSWEALTEKVKAISTPDTFSWRKGIDSALRILLELVPTLTKVRETYEIPNNRSQLSFTRQSLCASALPRLPMMPANGSLESTLTGLVTKDTA